MFEIAFESNKKLAYFTKLIFILPLISFILLPQIQAPAPFDQYFTSAGVFPSEYGKIHEEGQIENEQLHLETGANKCSTSSSSQSSSSLMSPSTSATASASPSPSKLSNQLQQLPLNELISSVLKIYPTDVREELDGRVRESGANERQLRAIFQPIHIALMEKNIKPKDVKKLCTKNKKFGFPCLIELLAQLGALRHLNKLSLFKDITHQTVSMEEEYKNGDEDDPIVWIMRKLMPLDKIQVSAVINHLESIDFQSAWSSWTSDDILHAFKQSDVEAAHEELLKTSTTVCQTVDKLDELSDRIAVQKYREQRELYELHRLQHWQQTGEYWVNCGGYTGACAGGLIGCNFNRCFGGTNLTRLCGLLGAYCGRFACGILGRYYANSIIAVQTVVCGCERLGEIAKEYCQQTLKIANAEFCQHFGTDFCALRDAQIKYTEVLAKQFGHLLAKTDEQKEAEALFTKWIRFRNSVLATFSLSPSSPKFQFKWQWVMHNDRELGAHFVMADCLSHFAMVLNLVDDASPFFSQLRESNANDRIEKWIDSSEQLSAHWFSGGKGKRLVPTLSQQLEWLCRTIHSMQICFGSTETEVEIKTLDKIDKNNIKQLPPSQNSSVKRKEKQKMKTSENKDVSCEGDAKENLIAIDSDSEKGSPMAAKVFDNHAISLQLGQMEKKVAELQAKLKREKWRMRSSTSSSNLETTTTTDVNTTYHSLAQGFLLKRLLGASFVQTLRDASDKLVHLSNVLRRNGVIFPYADEFDFPTILATVDRLKTMLSTDQIVPNAGGQHRKLQHDANIQIQRLANTLITQLDDTFITIGNALSENNKLMMKSSNRSADLTSQRNEIKHLLANRLKLRVTSFWLKELLLC